MLSTFYRIRPLILWLLPGLIYGCEYKTGIVNPEDYTQIYMAQARDEPISYNLLMSDTAQYIIYGANVSGTDFPSADIPISFEVDMSLVEDFNEDHATEYLPMPQGSFELETLSSVIPKGKTSTEPLKISIKTIDQLTPATKYLLPVSIKSEGKEKVSEAMERCYYLISADYEYLNLSLVNGGNSVVPASIVTSADPTTINFQAQYAGVNAGNDVDVKFKIDNDLVTSFNALNGTEYLPMPEGSVLFTDDEATIPKGLYTTSQIPITIKTEGFLTSMVQYLLPVIIDTATGDLGSSKKINLDTDERVQYFLIESKQGSIDLTIVSFGKKSGDNDLQLVADYIKAYNADMAIIRQIDVNTTRSGPADQSKQLSELLDMPYYVFANALNYQGGFYGMGLFSKYSIETSENKTFMLPSGTSEQAPVGVVKVEVADGVYLYFGGTQLAGPTATRTGMQMQPLADSLGKYTDFPFIFGGNLNSIPDNASDAFQLLKNQEDFIFPCDDCSLNATGRTDYVMYRPALNFETISFEIDTNPIITTYVPAILKVRFYY